MSKTESFYLLRRRAITSPSVRVGLAVTTLLAIFIGYIIATSHAAVTEFVTRSGTKLILNNAAFRFSGANIYWVGLDDNIRDSNGQPTYPTHFRIDNAFTAAQTMHATVARTHSVGISLGCPKCIEPSLGTFNDAAFESIDYAVKSAGQHDIRLQVPLIDEWRYYHGGKWNFVHWAAQAGVPGVLDTNPDMNKNAGNDSGSASSEKNLEEQFYTNPTIISNYQAYVSHILNHVNQYTGIALKDDPTILDWETGNELFDAPTSWTSMMAAYIKTTIGAKQLVADGSGASGNHDANAAVTDSNVDIIQDHFYAYPTGLDTSWLATDAQTAHDNNKVFIVGEYAWTRSERPAFLTAIERNANVSGDMLWAILPHEEDGTPEPHGSTTFGQDDVALYYPTTSGEMATAFAQLTQHADIMGGTVPTPTQTPTPMPSPSPTPLPTPPGSLMINDTQTSGSPVFSYTGSWATSTGTGKYNGDDHYTSSGGDSASFSFIGSRAQIYGAKASHHGIANFSVDNGPTSVVDLYSASRIDEAMIFDSGVLSGGNHIIRITNTGTKNSSSTSTVITIDAAAYVPAGAATPVPTSPPSPVPTQTITPVTTPTPKLTVKIGDVNGDGAVGIVDLSLLLGHWGSNYSAADFNHDGTINIVDLSLLLGHWGQ